METIYQYWTMFKRTSGDRLFLSFLVFYFIDCALILWTDPSIHSYPNALWMGFSVATTIGLGDYTVTTGIARFLTILLGVYGSIIEAYIPGLIASYYLQKFQQKRDRIFSDHARELSSLSEMNHEQKKALSASIRKENAQ